jgi:hypothetical protein
VVIQILPTFFSHGSLSALLAPATPLPFFPEFVKRAKDFSCDIADYHQDPLLNAPLRQREALSRPSACVALYKAMRW